MEAPDDDDESQSGINPSQRKKKAKKDDEELKVHILVAKKTTLKQRLRTDDEMFVDFLRWMLEVDPLKRPSAQEAMTHPWLAECKYTIEDWYLTNLFNPNPFNVQSSIFGFTIFLSFAFCYPFKYAFYNYILILINSS